MFAFALVILTLSPTGDYHISVTEAESYQQCEQQRTMISGVLRGRGTEPIEARCASNVLALEPYQHGRTAEDYQYLYQLQLLEEEALTLTALPANAPCLPATQQSETEYCVKGSQRVRAD